jgi:type II secretory ATPase GspE/PulE/Tfp pilus assembly ATPase PilB-like protein
VFRAHGIETMVSIDLLDQVQGHHIPSSMTAEGLAVPVGPDAGGSLIVAISAPFDYTLKSTINRLAAPTHVKFVYADRALIQRQAGNVGAAPAASEPAPVEDFQALLDRDVSPLTEAAISKDGDTPTISAGQILGDTLVARLFEDAVRKRATDIHVDPYSDTSEGRKGMRIRFRLDKVLRAQPELCREGDTGLRAADIIARTLKISSGVDIGDREAQDFRVRRLVGGRTVYARVHTHPAHIGTGETATKSTIRILETRRRDLNTFGFTPDVLEAWRDVLAEGSGMLLVSGPMGSGKSSAVFASMPEVVNSEIAAYTIEDPVEFELPGVTQYEITARSLDERARVMKRALHDIRRQDANFVLVGEIRDKESMELAFDLATSGIRVMATVHAASAIHTIQRLLEWQLDPFIIATTLRAVLNMRLLQRLCESCRIEVDHDSDHGRSWPLVTYGRKLPDRGWKPNLEGCAACTHTGTTGQFPIAELLTMAGTPLSALKSAEGVASLGRGLRSLEDQAYDALIEGRTHFAATKVAQIGGAAELITGALDDDPRADLNGHAEPPTPILDEMRVSSS